MPRVKLDYVVSFSSEDPENPASNLLAWDVSKKRWLCAKGEPSCSVVLQLPRAVKISAVHVGAHHAALVEVLVGRSEKPNEPFQVLVPSCIFLTPAESRKDVGIERVRSFTANQLSASAREQRWDRVRVVCSQPYNKHCKYGLNFVHISEPEGTAASCTPSADAAAALPGDAGSSSDDEFRPGELFAKLKSPGAADTGAQIRQATSHALKNISDSATKLVKTPISKHSKRQASSDEPCSSNRQRETLMYTDDDDRPHAKIDHIVQRHKDQKSKDEAKKPTEMKHDRKPSKDVSKDKKESQKASEREKHKDINDKSPKDDRKNRRDPATPASTSTIRVSKDDPSTSNKDRADKDRKRSRDDKQKAGGDFGSILQGVTFVLSGYANPRRAEVRDKAVAMGARYEKDWGPRCNYLICAFPNTPKLKQVRSAPGGGAVPAVLADWVQASHARRRRLPWRWFATEARHRETPPPGYDDDEAGDDNADECDTDDEIEKALRKQKKRRTESSPTSRDEDEPERDRRDASRTRDDASETRDDASRTRDGASETRDDASRTRDDASRTRDDASGARDDARESNTSANLSNASDVTFVRDERMQGNVTVVDSDDEKTDEEDGVADTERIDKSKSLPNLFSGSTFAIGASAARAHFDVALLERYVRAYGGLVVDADQVESDSSVSYVLCCARESNPCGATLVRPDWLWRCHAERRLCPTHDYRVT